MVRCPNCGEQTSGEDCPICKYPLPTRKRGPAINEKKDEENLTESLWRDFFGKAIRNMFIFGIILAVVWEVLTWVVPEGWPMAVVNIFFFIISLWAFGYTLLIILKATLPTWFAWVVSLVCWALLFIGLRSLLAFIFT